MKQLLMLLAALSLSVNVQAALYDRGAGLIYDDVLNVTWLQDANYAQTSGHDADGKMDWAAANTWAANLEYFDTVRNVSYDDWRLPAARPANGVSYVTTFAADGSTDHGIHMTAGNTEMPHLFYADLHGQATRLPDNTPNPNYDPSDVSSIFQDAANGNIDKSFINLQSGAVNIPGAVWWTNQELDTNTSINFFRAVGFQSSNVKTNEYFAWAVRDGDVAVVPIPGAIWLFGTGLVGLAGMARRKMMAK